LGIGYGECALLYVGGVFGRAEFFTIGTALVYALRSEAQATAGGQILVSETAFKYVRKLYSATEKISEPDLDHHNPGGEKFYQIRDLIGEGIKTRADALVLRSNISNETYIKISQ
jgi:predicted amino acid racemase